MSTDNHTPIVLKNQAVLEAMIDAGTLAGVLEDLAEICAGKASHIQENWQDCRTAWPWVSAARSLGKLSGKVRI